METYPIATAMMRLVFIFTTDMSAKKSAQTDLPDWRQSGRFVTNYIIP
ncbi:MAG: hypothetical protein V1871_04190 [Planctomycetota bacterium]